ncbi:MULTISPECIES: sulfurtransferase TusA family protein [unclassified Brevundimonas]|uniref:sulfurtransferase TusA family protein n=1 Tax=unclassified Brevundimonas TaxID=2622653 RepID=UPI0025C022C8|nr:MULTISPECIES: sulfurtransferase TusA family protein [unclassified Brevundimonas]
MNEPVVIDARGHRCPVPSLKLRKAMEAYGAGQRMTLLATDPMARIDVPFLMQETGGRVVEVVEEAGVLRLTVETGGALPG